MNNLLQVNNLKVAFGGVVALNLEHFELADKELRVIIGPNGAGKSTFMDVLSGKTKPVKGNVNFAGESLLGSSEVDIARKGIGRKFQKPSVFPSLSVYDNLLLALKMSKDILSSFRFKMSALAASHIDKVAEKVGLSNSLSKIAGTLSHGQKQWLEIAIVMLQNPKLMLIDEPAAGMSDDDARQTADLLIDLVKDHAIIVIEHDMRFVEQIAIEKVNVFVQGNLLTEGSFEQVRNDPRVIDSYLGKDAVLAKV
ncbi:MAG: urea ABC transporter ATP-binding protein UrtD [Bacteroidota bacterium]